ncbi:hypothetical protein BCR34DRAFT_449321, partial [Clohesyomyces aquaticus]
TRPFFPPLRTPSDDLCAGFPKDLLKSVQVVLKTGAGEKAKAEAHLATVTSCIPNLIVVSDLEDDVDHQHVIDILAELPASYSTDNLDFAAYITQKEANKNGNVEYSKEGWKLDRFKFLPMVEKAYWTNPRASWYVFMEVDVYYFWDTLFRFLDQLDPARMHYMGSPAPGANNLHFAYGGAGFVLSKGLMDRLVGRHLISLSVEYEEWIKNDCCGDAVFGYAIYNRTGVKLEPLYPIFAGDELRGLKIDEERWCIPILALHRVNPEQMKDLWKWERTRPYDELPIYHSKLLPHIFPPLAEAPMRNNWDNWSGDLQPEDSVAHASSFKCRSSCFADPTCLQYSYSAKQCRFGHAFQQGKPADDKDREFVSGWDVEKLSKLGFEAKTGVSGGCEDAQWIRPGV